MNSHGIPPFSELLGLIASQEQTFDFLFQEGILTATRTCACGSTMLFDSGRMGYRCTSRKCRREFSVFKGTIFFKSRLPINAVLHLAHLWLCGSSVSFAERYTGHCRETVSVYYSHFRSIVASALEPEDLAIGGPGVIVEIDETKVGKRKNNQGHTVEGFWVFGGVERTEARRIFLVRVPNRSAATLIDILRQHVLPGTIVYSDMWRGYIHISTELEVAHCTVNHSLYFVDPETNVHTNTIEGTWSTLKSKIPIRHRTQEHSDAHLFEFIWRRLHGTNLWRAFMDAMRYIEFIE